MAKYISKNWDKPSMRGKAPKAGKELAVVGKNVMEGAKAVKVPEGRTKANFMLALRKFLSRRGKKAKISSIGDSELYVRLEDEHGR